ncbi:MAG: response regulator [Candidatus Eremiobacteraeota bacterium]|nr:response regulator [Candidatus Eremiobacteraeota bacterium]MCW5871208.1 response regulator [Candidatus Eremiobacteraeota bacterium]
MKLPTVAAVGSDYRYLWVDANWCRVHSIPQEQAVGRSLAEVWGARTFEHRFKRLFDRALLGEALVQRVHTRGTDGRKKVVQIHLAPVQPPSGPPFVISTVTELTESAEFQGQREGLEGKLNLIFQGEKVMNLLLTPESRILRFSPALCPYLCAGDPDIAGKSLIALLESSQSDDVVDEFYQALRKAANGNEQVFEVTLACNRGGLADFQFCVRPRLGEEGLEFYHLSAFEVTDRNASLRETEDQLHSLFKIAPAPMLIGLEGTIVQANPAAQAMLGLEDEQSLIGSQISSLFPSLLNEMGQGTRIRRQDGVEIQVQMTVTPWMRSGRCHQLYLFYNLTEQKQVLEALQAAAVSAELASRTKTSFLRTMSHEIRTPLNGVLGLLYLLQLNPDEAKKAAYLDKLGQAARGMLAIVNDVLDYSLHESSGGDVALQVEDFELAEVLEELLQAMKGWLKPDQALQLDFELAPQVPQRLRGDAGKLRRILFNLGHNAVRFTPRGRVLVRVDVVAQEGDSCTLEFAISDTGIGMGPEYLEGLFTPFRQGDSSASRSYGGVGLGLFLSQRFVEILGGTIRAESELGRGSRFLFTVCLASPLGAEAAAAQKLISFQPPEWGGLRGQVLVVDDNDINQEVAAEMLRQLGITAHLAAGGAQAIELAQKYAYDAILMDLQMPGMDGLETAARLREQGATVPILALTANTRLEDRQACRVAGMDDFLAKPVRPQALYQALKRFLKVGEAPSSLPSPDSEFPPLEGVDCRQGLERLGGNQRLFKTLLVQFGRRNETTAWKLRKALEAGDLKQVRALSHTLKGAAGNLGMDRLSTLSMQVETAARAESPPPPELLGSLEEELARVIRLLATLEESSPAEMKRTIDPSQVIPLLDAFLAQLQIDLGEAFQLSEQLGELTRGTSLEVQRSQLQACLDDFDLDCARETASEMMAALQEAK